MKTKNKQNSAQTALTLLWPRWCRDWFRNLIRLSAGNNQNQQPRSILQLFNHSIFLITNTTIHNSSEVMLFFFFFAKKCCCVYTFIILQKKIVQSNPKHFPHQAYIPAQNVSLPHFLLVHAEFQGFEGLIWSFIFPVLWRKWDISTILFAFLNLLLFLLACNRYPVVHFRSHPI